MSALVGTAFKEAAENAAKLAAKDAGKEAAEAAVKQAVKDSGKEAIELAAKDAAKGAAVNTAQTAAKTAAKDSVTVAGKETAQSIAAKSAKYVAAGVVVAGGAAYIATQTSKLNGSKYTIQSIAPASSSGGLLITYSPGQKFNSSGDTLTLSATNCVPPIDGTTAITSTPSLTSVVVPGTVTSKGTQGQITLNTTFESQMDNDLSGAGKAAGGAVGGAASGVVGGVVGGVASGLGLDKVVDFVKANLKWFVIALVVALCLSSAGLALKFAG